MPGEYEHPLNYLPNYRISENGKLWQVNLQVLYSTIEMLEAANNKLNEKKSFIKLVKHPHSTKRINKGETLWKVIPKWNPQFAPTTRGFHRDLGLKNQNERAPHIYYSHADCHLTAQTVMGSDSAGIIDTEHCVLKNNEVLPNYNDKNIKDHPHLMDAHANRAVYAFFDLKFAGFAAKLGLTEADIKSELQEIGLLKFGNKKVHKCWSTYKKILNNKKLARLLAEHFEINEAIDPDIGEGITQVNNDWEVEKARAEKDGADLWNFHWAAVVMKDGKNYVTLENLSKGDRAIKNREWYFKMYGPSEQSFHSEAKKDPHVGKSPITLKFRNMPAVRAQAQTYLCPKCNASFTQRGKFRAHTMYECK